ncbi:MAG: DUF4124 domain-containing protein [Gammaproteobacteria bacterium]|nr:DUF4124 domain-containing protein [Gammaproteobacteria bacterium]
MTRHFLASLTAILLLLTCGYASAAIYKWRNEEGQINYGSMPPQGVAAEKMGVSTKFTPPPAKNISNSTTKTDQTTTSKKDKDPYTQAQHDSLCETSKKDLASLNQGGRLRVKQDDGSSAVMTDTDKEKRIKTMQDMMKKHCK